MSIVKKIGAVIIAAVTAVSMSISVPAADSEEQIVVISRELKAQSGKVKISKLTFSKVSNQTYTGKEIKPAVTVTQGSKKLVKGTDYTISYKNNKSVGTATIIITGKGKYTGTKKISFKILPGTSALTVKNDGGRVSLSWGTVKGADTYQINYSVNGGGFKTLAVVSSNSYSTTKLDAGKYQFKVRAYTKLNGKIYYGGFSSAKKVTVAEKTVPPEKVTTVQQNVEVSESISHMVWVPTNGGKKYHTSSKCSNMKDPKQVSLSTAIAEGFTPCKRCH